jgi:hypothetical protein
MKASVQNDYRQVLTHLDRHSEFETLAGRIGKTIARKEVEILKEISKGSDAKYSMGGDTFTGEAALMALQAAYQRLQRVWSTFQSILQSRHQLMMEAIRNIGRG